MVVRCKQSNPFQDEVDSALFFVRGIALPKPIADKHWPDVDV